jgi:hypothetical protein
MKAASVNEIKQELKRIPHTELVDICLRLARYKKENKELLTYLLFESADIETYRKSVKQQMEDDFSGINTSSIYFAKKGLRKIIRITNKYIRYAGCKETEADLLIHFCILWKSSDIGINKTNALSNLYQAQQKKIFAAIAALHEDLQHDYIAMLGKLDEKPTTKLVKQAKVISFLGIKL